MKPLGKMLLSEPMVTLSALTTFVECTSQLPEPDLVPVGALFRLVSSQRGYTALHYYLCREHEGRHVWFDITADPGLVPDPGRDGHTPLLRVVRNISSLSPDPSIPAPKALRLIASYTVTSENFSVLHNDTLDGSPVYDKFSHDVLIAKSGGFPTSIEDGTEMFKSEREDGVSNVIISGSRLGRLVSDASAEIETYNFRMFRVFESGYTTYVDEVWLAE